MCAYYFKRVKKEGYIFISSKDKCVCCCLKTKMLIIRPNCAFSVIFLGLVLYLVLFSVIPNYLVLCLVLFSVILSSGAALWKNWFYRN